MAKIEDAYDSGNFNITAFLAEVQQVSYLFIKYCEFDDALVDLVKWCGVNDCRIPTMFQTLLKKVFQVTTVANEIAEAFKTAPAKDDLVAV
jgi:hypothetical protein